MIRSTGTVYYGGHTEKSMSIIRNPERSFVLEHLLHIFTLSELKEKLSSFWGQQ